MRTSHTHPLQIGTIPVPGLAGRLGLTFCPGKTDPLAMTGAWARDLATDLQAIVQWGATDLVCLMEAQELAQLRVPGLGEAARAAGLAFHHLPIRDAGIPDRTFEAAWHRARPGIRDALARGGGVLIHCRGGLGRTGLLAARLLVEFGTAPGKAIAEVRAARPGAIETAAQEAHVRRRMQPWALPPLDPGADRAVGALLGLAIGDALGTTLEFTARDSGPPLTDIVGGGPFALRAGEWTDDTSMALCLADSLLCTGGFDPGDLMRRFVRWWQQGENSMNGRCFDIGITTRDALARFRRTGNPQAGDTDPMTAGNGSIMRLAPVVLRWAGEPETALAMAEAQGRTTHAAPAAVEGCRLLAAILLDAIATGDPAHALRPREAADRALAAVAAGGWRSQSRDRIHSGGYVVETLEAALWAVGDARSFQEALLRAVNLGGDADTVGAVTGQIAGALWGASAIPAAWRRRLAWGPQIEARALALWNMGRGGAAMPRGGEGRPHA